MSQFDPATITPPPELVRQLRERNYDWMADAISCYQAGAQFAADAFRHQWPEPITDRPPTEVDADDRGNVQYLGRGTWQGADWEVAASHGWPWLHTPRWRPAPPPTLREKALDILHTNGRTMDGRIELEPDQIETVIQALTEQGGEVEG